MQKVTILFWGGTPKFEGNAKKWVCGVIRDRDGTVQFTSLLCEIKSQLQHSWMLPYQNYSPDMKNYVVIA